MTAGRPSGSEQLGLTTPVERLPRVGAARARALAGLGLTNLGRLLAHLPARYERIEAESTIAELASLPRDAVVSARGEVSATRLVQRRPRPRFEAVLVDGTGRLDLVWFNAIYLRQKIQVGMRLRVQGKARRFGWGLQMANPSWEVVGEEESAPSSEPRIRPVYPASEEITSRQIEEVVASVLPAALPLIHDHLSPEHRRRRDPTYILRSGVCTIAYTKSRN
ncbi:hypothetical protein J4558_25455 [Leptolyngbya sp. 15MV]|nr:hypothetical protein J4558_25455 [Leptolyngbya sp. 15MV]